MPRQTKMQKMKGLWNASIALGCVLLVGLGIYGLGTINPVTSAQSNDSRLTVQGIDNIVQYLKEMEIYDPHDPTKKVVIGWDDTFGGVVIKGDVNMESIVVRAPGDANTAPNTNKAQSSTVIGGTGNSVQVSTDADTNKNLAIVAGAGNSINNAGNAFVAGGSSVRVQNASNAAVVAASDSSIA